MSLVEFASGARLVVGLLTRLCALVLVVVMIVAVATNRIHSIHVPPQLEMEKGFPVKIIGRTYEKRA